MSRPTSSDDLRHARPLARAQAWVSKEPLELEKGDRLEEVEICFETFGRLDEERSNAVLVCHAISGDSHVTRHDPEDDPGWWEVLVGPGKAIDTDRYFVICANVLGGCRGTTGPNFPSPGSGTPWGAEFPVVTVGDMVEVQRRLVDHLGIEKLRAVIGGSLGGLQTLAWGTRFPERLERAIVIAAAPRLSSQGIAFDIVGRNAIRSDPRFADGQYYQAESPEDGLALARMLAHITYLSDESMRAKFDPTRLQPREVDSEFESLFSVGSYLAHQGDKFVERFDANSYITLSTAMDLFDLGDTPAKLEAALAPSTCRWLFLSFSTDWLYPPAASRHLVDALAGQGKSVSSCEIASSAGHDSFLLPEGMDPGARTIEAFLEPAAAGPERASLETGADQPTSIFFANRLDYEIIQRLVPAQASVVDLGCGNGELLGLLRDRGHGKLLGIEKDQAEVIRCLDRGLDVIHADLDQGLAALPQDAFDVALLSQTLQSIVDVAGILQEICRIGRRGIVAFPNFAYRPLREMFMREGRLPKEEGLYAYDWHDTPNRRFPSILDFEELCAKVGIRIDESLYVNTASGEEVHQDPNLEADLAIVAIAR